MLRAALLSLFRQILRIYFRKVNVAGEAPSAEVGARLFLPNHVNGLVDPLLVLTTADCVISPIGKAPLWKIPVLGFLLDVMGAVPVVRRRDDPTKAAGSNDALFDQVGKHVAGRGNVLIFPEGTSHNEPHLVKIRSGPSRMMLRARTQGASDVTFQAVALEFEARDVFRSRALVLYGPVRHIDAIAPAATPEEEAAAAITKVVENDLAGLLVTGEDWDERRLIARVAELLAHESGDDSLLAWNELGRAVRQAGRDLAARSATSVDPVRLRVTAYFDALERAGLSDHHVAGGADQRSSLRRGRIGPIAMIALLPLAIVGFVLYALPYRVPRLAAKSSTADVASTLKLATGLILFPIWATLLAVLSVVFLPSPFGVTGAVLAFASPLPALFWLDAFEDGLLRRWASPPSLRGLRDAALEAIATARNDLPNPEQAAS